MFISFIYTYIYTYMYTCTASAIMSRRTFVPGFPRMRCTMSATWYVVNATWLIHVWHDSFTGDMTHSFLCDITQSYVIWLIHMWQGSSICDMTHTSTLCRPPGMSHVMSDMTHSSESWLMHMKDDSFMGNMTHACETWLLSAMHCTHYPSTSIIKHDTPLPKVCMSVSVCVSVVCVYVCVCLSVCVSARPVSPYAVQRTIIRCATLSRYVLHYVAHLVCRKSHVAYLIHVRHDSLMCDITHLCETWLAYMWHVAMSRHACYTC